MISENYHTHTYRCGHAWGSDEQYVQNAITAGVRVLGFSDHAAYRPCRHTERMNLSEIPAYFKAIRKLKEQYREEIDILAGLEVEYYPKQWDILSYYRQEADYLILGQHSQELDKGSSYGCNSAEQLFAYVQSLEEACAHGLCEYIAHPGVILYSYPRIDENARKAAVDIAQISRKYDIPLEINCGSGVHHNKRVYKDGERYPYPVREWLEIFAEQGCKMIIGLDAHSPNDFLTDEYINRALAVGDGLPLQILTHFDIRKEAEKHRKMFY